MNKIVISQNDKDKTFQVNKGDSIIVHLPETPTTGYRWTPDVFDENIIKLQGSEFSLAPDARIGGGGTRAFNLVVSSPGTVKIHLKLKRAWEPEDKAIKHYEVTIRAQ